MKLRSVTGSGYLFIAWRQCRRKLLYIKYVGIVVAAIFGFMTEEDWGE